MRLLFPVVASDSPSGGRKFVYHVVDFLNDAGIESYVVHPMAEFRLTWFENKTQVGYSEELFPARKRNSFRRRFKENASKLFNRPKNVNLELSPIPLKIDASDILVLPETRLSLLHELPSKCRKIILNQNPFFTFKQHFSVDYFNRPNPRLNSTLGKITCSTLNRQMQEFVFPDLKLVSATLFIEEIFKFHRQKKKQIAYMPRRNSNDAVVLLNMLRFRGLAEDVAIIPIDNMTQREVAAVLAESLIFWSFSHREGFGLPAAEAMASGCMVIGYSGNGGDEFFHKDYCCPVREGDLMSFVQFTEQILVEYKEHSIGLERKRELASSTILERYSKKKSRQSIIDAFKILLKEKPKG